MGYGQLHWVSQVNILALQYVQLVAIVLPELVLNLFWTISFLFQHMIDFLRAKTVLNQACSEQNHAAHWLQTTLLSHPTLKAAKVLTEGGVDQSELPSTSTDDPSNFPQASMTETEGAQAASTSQPLHPPRPYWQLEVLNLMVVTMKSMINPYPLICTGNSSPQSWRYRAISNVPHSKGTTNISPILFASGSVGTTLRPRSWVGWLLSLKLGHCLPSGCWSRSSIGKGRRPRRPIHVPGTQTNTAQPIRMWPLFMLVATLVLISTAPVWARWVWPKVLLPVLMPSKSMFLSFMGPMPSPTSSLLVVGCRICMPMAVSFAFMSLIPNSCQPSHLVP